MKTAILRKLALGMACVPLLFTAGCGGGGDSAAPQNQTASAFNGLKFTGTLSGGKSGDLELTIKDDQGNVVGTVTIDNNVYAATGTVSASGSTSVNFTSSKGLGQITGTTTASSFNGNWTGTIPTSTNATTSASYQGTVAASKSPSAGTTAPTTPVTPSISSYAGTYNLKADDGTTASFAADSGGKVTGCKVGPVVVCTGNLSLNTTGNAADFQITGNDGQNPIDTTASLKGSISSSGTVSGSYSGKSVSEGAFSGTLTGTKAGSTGATGIVSTTPATACFQALVGTWAHTTGGTWTFDGTNHAKLVLNSTNYGPLAQQITELEVSSCANSTMSYKLTRAALINAIDPSFAYNKTPVNSPTEASWDKTFTQAYTLSGSKFTFGNYTYAKQ